MSDLIFEEPRLAAIYDAVDGDRSDLRAYLDLVDELDGRAVLDIGCGTGTFACLLAARGVRVVGLDQARASLSVARRKHRGGDVRWLHGDVSVLPPLQVDVVTMTGNVAQVFLDGDGWRSVLRAAQAALRPGGSLVFEVRDPARRAWEGWNGASSHRSVEVPHEGRVETWVECTAVRPPFVSFRHTFVFERDGAVLTSDSTLRFRAGAEVVGDLEAAGFDVGGIRDAPDRPGLELVFLAQRPRGAGP